MVERSTASKPVHLVGTNLYFNSLSEAARETGLHLSMISRNINGHIPDVNGNVFELLEPAA
jgi:DNA-directed RNA polymerase specialized sigma54-like protein